MERQDRSERAGGRDGGRGWSDVIGHDPVRRQADPDPVIRRHGPPEQTPRCSPGGAAGPGATPRPGPRGRPRIGRPGGRSGAGRRPAGDGTRSRRGGRPGSTRRAGRPATRRSTGRPARPSPVSTSRWIRRARRGRGPRSPRQAAAADASIRPRSSSPEAATATPSRIASGTTSGGIPYRHRSGARRPPARSSTASSNVGDREAVGAGRLEDAPDRDSAVTVGVRLEDRLDPDARRDGGADRRQVRPEAVEVDLQPGRARERGQTGRGESALDRRLRRHDAGGGEPRPSAPNPRRAGRVRWRTVAARRLRASASSSGRSPASSPASPMRSRSASPAAPWR